ncbi:hypothetical protein H4Q26_001605 [Puccinia striiformis f. sp. tritici PST-130]|nr:hypothetical protein H4Q26_001605 [Puccinia striiformis f. sp. tritici PST-130]
MCTTSPPSCRKVTEIHPAKSSAKKECAIPQTRRNCNTRKATASPTSRIGHQAFRSLAEVDFDASDRTPTDLSIERLRTKKDLLTEVHSTLLLSSKNKSLPFMGLCGT